MRTRHYRIGLGMLAIAVSLLLSLNACQSLSTNPTGNSIPIADIRPTNDTSSTAESTPTSASSPTGIPSPTATAKVIRIDANGPAIPIDARIRGTNVPAWINATRFADATFRARTIASGATVMRLPGGSWSNYYDWLGCEMADSASCYWTWAARPTDFITFLRATGNEAMYTVNHNGTAKEAAALVAFFNGSVDDERPIGVDVRGRDWQTVGYWARLRRDHGNPEPLNIKLWEVGNELFATKPADGLEDCSPWGWEDGWTCDGTEYVNGTGSGANRREGYREFREAMRAVDPDILVGAVGVANQSDWGNWGNEVIAAAGDSMDFYSIHYYAYFNPPASSAEILAQPQATWSGIMENIAAAFDQYAGGRRVPVAVTEYNLFAVQEQDNAQLMTRAVNTLFTADTIGQMLQHGVTIANQWALGSGVAENGTDYGLLHPDTYARYPQYYVFPLWARFGDQMLPVTSYLPADTTLSVYAGRVDATTISVLAINKTNAPITTAVQVDGVPGIVSGTVDVLRAPSLDSQAVTLNGVSDSSDDLSNAPATPLSNPSNPLSYTFEPYSITLLRISVGS